MIEFDRTIGRDPARLGGEFVLVLGRIHAWCVALPFVAAPGGSGRPQTRGAPRTRAGGRAGAHRDDPCRVLPVSDTTRTACGADAGGARVVRVVQPDHRPYVHRSSRLGEAEGRVLHGLDLFWTAALTFVSARPDFAFLPIFLFVMLASAYRWGFVGTIATTAVTVALFVANTIATGAAPWQAEIATNPDANRTVIRIISLVLVGFLLAYLAEEQKRSRAELATFADLSGQPRVRLGLGGSVAAVSRGLSRAFDADAVCFVLQDYDTRETSLWCFDRAALDSADSPLQAQLEPHQQADWLFADPGRVWHGTRSGADTIVKTRAIQADVWPLLRDRVELPASIAMGRRFDTLVVANFGLADEWRGRVYLFNPRGRGNLDQSLHFLEGLVEHVTPALTNVFLLGRLRARITAAERGRVARELHDGAIQALLGIEMKVEALRRRPEPLTPAFAIELDEVQALLRREILELRELMQALRPVALDASEQLPDVLGSVVERFRRDTGVPARFMFTGGSGTLPPATALEVVRIVQEALVNVRKHSRAGNVLVRLTAGEGGCILVIEDDGVGFDFEGQLSGEELDRRRLGPAIIKERARIIGAHLTIESAPGAGARIELIVNRKHA